MNAGDLLICYLINFLIVLLVVGEIKLCSYSSGTGFCFGVRITILYNITGFAWLPVK